MVGSADQPKRPAGALGTTWVWMASIRRHAVTLMIALVILATVLGSLTVFVINPFQCRHCPASWIFGLSDESNSSRGSIHWYNFTFQHDAPSNMTAQQLSFSVWSTSCGPLAGLRQFVLAFASGPVFAIQNASSGVWTSGGSALLPASGLLSVVFNVNVTGGWLIAYYGGHAVSTEVSLTSGAVGGC